MSNDREKLHDFLGEDGVIFFEELFRDAGSLNVVFSKFNLMHSVNQIEGKEVRTFMETLPSFKDKDVRNEWEDFIIENLDLRRFIN